MDKLLRSTLATKDDSDIVQVIAKHAALDESGQEDEHGADAEEAGDKGLPQAGA
jgi:hypothetical protein